MMKLNISLEKNNFSMTLTQKKNLLHIQFINHHFILKCHRNLTFLPKSGKHSLKAPNKWPLSTTRKSSSTTLHHTLVGARLNLTLQSVRFMPWILCGDSRLNPQIPLPLRPITTFFGMQLTSMIFTTPRRDLRERHSYPNMRKSMMKMDISLKQNNLSMTLTQKKNLPHIQFFNPHFILRLHRNPTFLLKFGKHFLKAPNKWSLSTTRKSSSTTLHHTLVGARLNLTLHWVSPILPHNKFISIHKMMLKKNHLLTLLPRPW